MTYAQWWKQEIKKYECIRYPDGRIEVYPKEFVRQLEVCAREEAREAGRRRRTSSLST